MTLDADAPPPPPVSAAADQLRKRAREWGVREDQPEGAFIQAMGDLLVAFEERLDATSKTTEDFVRGIVRRAAATAMADASRTFQRAETWRGLALVAGVAVIALG